jgi:hypothetical protein
MEFNNSKLKEVTHRIALVQGESFRCMAVEGAPNRWTKLDDGTELPHVLEILHISGSTQPIA